MKNIFDVKYDHLKTRTNKRGEFVDIKWISLDRRRMLSVCLGPNNLFEICLEEWEEKYQDWSMSGSDIFDGDDIKTREQCWEWLQGGQRPSVANYYELHNIHL